MLDTGELRQRRSAAYALLRREPDHRDAHLRLYEIEQMLGQPTAALAHLRAALRSSPLVQSSPDLDNRVRVLALSRIARWEANVPLELVIDERRFALTRLYLGGDERLDELVARVPPHDVLFNSIAESDEARPVLALADGLVRALEQSCINAPQRVRDLGRDRVARRFAQSTTVVAPPVERETRDALGALELAAPLVVRPVGSQAGFGLERLTTADERDAYVERFPVPFFYVMPFIDYRSADGFYRKYRIVFVAGVPYAVHLAISPRWMIHYYNAPMSEHAWMRTEEAAFIGDAATVFDGMRDMALREIAGAVDLPYFGIDCSITRDGRVLLFEADAAMLVHASDPSELYPYKRAGFERIQAALTVLLDSATGA